MKTVDMNVKMKAVGAVAAGGSVKDVAEQFGVGVTSLRRWMKGIPQMAAPVSELEPAVEVETPKAELTLVKAKEPKTSAEKTIVEINQDVTYRNGKTIFRKRILLKGKKYEVVKALKAAITNPADISDDAEREVISEVATALFNGNKSLAATYVRGTVDEFRAGVAFL
jgi:transposase-like protein